MASQTQWRRVWANSGRVEDAEAWRAAARGATESWPRRSDWTTTAISFTYTRRYCYLQPPCSTLGPRTCSSSSWRVVRSDGSLPAPDEAGSDCPSPGMSVGRRARNLSRNQRWPCTQGGSSWLCAELLRYVRLFATPWTIPTRLLCPWDSPGKNTGGGCHTLLQWIF